jgi:hypothetical protein
MREEEDWNKKSWGKKRYSKKAGYASFLCNGI